MNITERDIAQLTTRGIALEELERQYESLVQGISYVDLRGVATNDDGLLVLNNQEQYELVNLFESKKSKLELLKFTPASGAATRMFKFLFEFLEDYNPTRGSINAYINKNNVPELRLFFVGLDSFPFFKEVRSQLKMKYGEEGADVNENRLRFVKMMLDQDGLNYGKKPKGLFPFHAYKKHIASAFEEHLFESALYASNNHVANLHFTISEGHLSNFKERLNKRKEYITQKTNVKFNISYSFQSSSTDTIALTQDNKLLKDKNGDLIFRPGGHGALINNLNKQDADIIFIKNIDNVVVFQFKEQVAYYKKMLAGKLITLQEKTFAYLKLLLGKADLVENEYRDIVNFISNDLFIKLPKDFERYETNYKKEYLIKLLDRPIRVCGMVENEGEPGGGPFWVRDEQGRESLQIVEGVQINPHSKTQQGILQKATHFNPVDIVCGIRNYKGEKYDLHRFVDQKAGFITSKSYQGQKIKALEHPGLWNGGMAYWNTVFVEVPLVTFNPVKTVNDLLKPAHQVK